MRTREVFILHFALLVFIELIWSFVSNKTIKKNDGVLIGADDSGGDRMMDFSVIYRTTVNSTVRYAYIYSTLAAIF